MRIFAVAALLFCTGAAGATEFDFSLCDGYPAPTRKGDNLTTTSQFWGLATSTADIRKANQIGAGPSGVRACDRALADPLLLPTYVLRRANLLQARAVNQIASSDPNAALESIRQSDALGAQTVGPWFAESVGIGNMALRAFIFINEKKFDAARSEITKIDALRGYAASINKLDYILSMRIDASTDAELNYFHLNASRNPNLLIPYFWNAISSGQLARAAEIGDQISYDLPKARGNWRVDGEEQAKYDLITARAEQAGAYSYALAATGRKEVALGILDSARHDLEEAMSLPPPPAVGEQIHKSVLLDFEKRTAAGQEGGAALNRWAWAIEFRAAASFKTIQSALDELKGRPGGYLPVIPDIIGQIPVMNPTERATRESFVADLYKRLDSQRLIDMKIDLITLVNALPKPETPAMQPKFHKAGDGYFLSDNGFSVRKLPDSDVQTVRFTHAVASPATVEELALLSAAMLAQQNGRDGLLLVSRRTLVRTTRQYDRYFRDATEIPSGTEAQINVLFISGNTIPSGYGNGGWRILRVAELIADIGRRYPELINRSRLPH